MFSPTFTEILGFGGLGIFFFCSNIKLIVYSLKN